MRPRVDASEPAARGLHLATTPAGDVSREAQAVAELLLGVFRRDVQMFLPRAGLRPLDDEPPRVGGGPAFRLTDADEGGAHEVTLFGRRFALALPNRPLLPLERRMVVAIARVLIQRYHDLFHVGRGPRLELYRGGSEDHYVAAFVAGEDGPDARDRQQRIAATIQTLRTAALSTYENRRVSTGALLLGPSAVEELPAVRRTAQDALAYGVELTALKSVHRLCDGRRTLFLVDADGKLADIVDVADWAAALGGAAEMEVPCARAYQPHARATGAGGNVCLVLSPNQEIKLFAEGRQVFAFTHGRWRILDPATRFARWAEAVANPTLARILLQAAFDLAEDRQGALFVVVRDPDQATGRLIAAHDRLDIAPDAADLTSSSELPLLETGPLARRALHYLARGRLATELTPSVLEALASLDGALVTDPTGRLLAFGAILHHDAAELRGLSRAEGARTTAALVASLYGPVLKVSEDGIVSCFLEGGRVWEL